MRFAVLVRCVACRRQILLCDKCDVGYHTACLRPPLMIIPDGHWFCPPCEQVRTRSAGLCRLHCHGVQSVELVVTSGMLPFFILACVRIAASGAKRVEAFALLGIPQRAVGHRFDPRQRPAQCMVGFHPVGNRTISTRKALIKIL